MAKRSQPKSAPGWRRTFIKEWREAVGVEQDDLADKMGISVPYLSQLENGRRRYNQDMLEKAADALGCEPPDLLKPPAAEDDLAGIFGTLSPEQKAHIAEIAKTFKR